MSKEDDFKALQAKWYKKLATTPDKNGDVFKDIENTTRADRPLLSWHNLRFKTISVETRRLATESYYEKASQLTHSYKFKNATHRKIWELHCQGLSRRKIARAIKDLKPSYEQARIGYIIQDIAKSVKG